MNLERIQSKTEERHAEESSKKLNLFDPIFRNREFEVFRIIKREGEVVGN